MAHPFQFAPLLLGPVPDASFVPTLCYSCISSRLSLGNERPIQPFFISAVRPASRRQPSKVAVFVDFLA